jgi:hypothetical protein
MSQSLFSFGCTFADDFSLLGYDALYVYTCSKVLKELVASIFRVIQKLTFINRTPLFASVESILMISDNETAGIFF